MRRRLRGLSVRRRKQARDYVVTVDGVEARWVVAFDTRQGWVRCHSVPLRVNGVSLAQYVRHGRVRVERAPWT